MASTESANENTALINNRNEEVKWSMIACHWFATVSMVINHYIVEAAAFIIVPLYVSLYLHSTTRITGYLMFLWGFATIIAYPLAGHISLKYGSIFLMILAVLIRTVGFMLIFLLYEIYPMWYPGLFFIGVAQTFFMQSISMYIKQHIPIHKRGRFNTSAMSLRRLSLFIGSLESGMLIYNDSVKYCIMIQTIISSVGTLLICLVYTPPNYYSSINERSSFIALKKSYQDLNVFKRFGDISTWIERKDITSDNSTEMTSIWTVFKICWKELLLISIFTFGLYFARAARRIIITFQGQYINLNAKDIGFMNAVSYIPDTLLFPLTGYLMDNHGRRYSAMPCLTLFSVALLSISFCTTMDYLTINALIFGFADGLASGLAMTVGMDIAPAKYKDQFISLYRMLASIPNFLGPLMIGYLSDTVNILTASWISAGFTIISLLYTMFFMPEPKQIALQDQENQNNKNINSLPLKQ